MQPIKTTSRVDVDWTRCFGYETLISEEIEHYSTIELTEGLKEGGVAANWAWERWYNFLAATWKTSFVGEVAAAARRFERPRLLSLGCGYGGWELEISHLFQRDHEIVAVDCNEALFRQVRETVARQQLPIEFQALDLNFVEIEESSFDVVFAHAALHHLLNFEHLFEQIYRGLRDGGRLIVLDIIGKTQQIFWPENIQFATDLVARMPERLRAGLEIDARALFPSYLDGAEQDGMEGIRQEELEEQLERHFRPLLSHKYNSFVRLLCTHPILSWRFDPDLDAEYVDSLFRLDLEQIATGNLRASEMFVVCEKRPRHRAPAAPRGNGRAAASGPLVSVLVACDGPARSLQSCVDSLLAQTHRPLEVLLVAGSAAEEVSGLARDLDALHPEVRLVQSDPAAGWLGALPLAAGEYVAGMSCRDTWYPVKLERHVAFLQANPQVGLTYAPVIVVDERGRRTSRAFGVDVLGEDVNAGPPDGGEIIPRSAALFRRACWQEDLTEIADEHDLWRRISASWRAHFEEQPLGMLRIPA